MKDPRSRNHIVEIPIHWTAAQADAVCEFITVLELAVFDAYADMITELNQPNHPAPQTDAAMTKDDYPF